MARRRFVLSLGLLSLVGALTANGHLAAAPAGVIHLPDLHTLIPLNEMSIVRPTPTTREFRYTHITANLGDGPFEVRPQYDPTTDTALGFQRLYTHNSAGTWSIVTEQRVVGRFAFHAVHGHFHFPLVMFGLFHVGPDGSIGPPAAMSAKIGYCIADSLQVADIPHLGAFRTYNSGAGCNDPTTVRGISVGWGDRYDLVDDGQSIDITNLPDGEYWFRALSDPFNYFAETDKTNNATDVKLHISGTSVVVREGPVSPTSRPPSISMTAPAAGAVAGSNVVVSADAADPSGITRVQFVLDGNPLGPPLFGPPYIVQWDTTAIPDGVHDLSAQVVAGSGFQATAATVLVTVSNNAPPPPPPPASLYISNVFAGNRTSSTTTVTWTTNLPADSKVDYGLGPTYGASATDAALVTTHAVLLSGLSPETTYHYQVTSLDDQGHVATAGDFIFTTAGVSELSCAITAPEPGATVSGTVTISADSAGTASISGVQFAIDGTSLGAEDAMFPYSIDWDTTLVGNGVHAITAVAQDPTHNQARCGPVSVTVSNAPPPPPTGLVLALAFNEGANTMAADVSGRANHGSLSGPAWVNGRYGKALSFDGVNDLVTVNDAASLDLVGPMTLEAWVNPRTLASWRSVLLKERPSSLAYALYGNTDTNRPSVELMTGTSQDARASVQLALNTWSHLAATYDGSTLRLYLNATQVAARGMTGAVTVSSNPLRIGGNLIWGEYFDGVIDEVRLYNRVLTPAELQTDMNTPVGGTPPPDTTAPLRTNGQPSGTLAAGTTSATLQLTTDEGATCRYSTSAGISYAAMPNTFAITGNTPHSTTVSGLVNGNSYTYYVRCSDAAANANTTDFSIAFAVATPPADTTPPVRTNGQPSGTLAAGTTSATLQLTTNEGATCRYSTTAGISYPAMPNTFAMTGNTAHSTTVSGLVDGSTYPYYVRCSDVAGNANTTDFSIVFTVATPTVDTTPPARTNGQPSGTLAAGTTSATLQVTTGEPATCRYSTTANTGYSAMPNVFSTTGGTAQSTPVTGLLNGQTYSYFVRCADAAGNVNTNDFTISFAVASASAGLVAAYGFEETTGLQVNDASGGGRNGTIAGATRTAGRFGRALSFDGLNDLVTVPDSNALDLTAGMTLEAWVNPRTLSGWRSLILKERQSSLAYALYANTDTGVPSGEVSLPSNRDTRATSPLAIGAWTHVAVTYNATMLRLYMNGLQVSSRAVSGPIVTSSNPLRLGGNTVWGEDFDGILDEVRLYNRALSAAEIQTDMTRPIQP